MAAASLVIGLLVLIVGPIWYWIFFRMDERPNPPPDTEAADSPPMDATGIARIESSLGVGLPDDLKHFLVRLRDEFDPDDVTILNDAETIIELTRQYRRGFAKLLPWPEEWVCIGDESDACPYYVNCKTGEFVQLYKGNPAGKPLRRYRTFAEFLALSRKEAAADAEIEKLPLTWKDTVRFYTPMAAVLVFMFVILPLIGLGATSLFRWLFR